jgi:hypothetical protein
MFRNHKPQLDRIELQLSAIQTNLDELLRRPVNEPEKIIASASLCFKQGVEASKVESMQCAQPVYLNPEARADFRQAAEARGMTEAQAALRDPNNADWLSGDELTRED